ncbi:MAG: NADH-quinone oxidoreductase subunit N [Bacteroidales bacterium]|nr:NADH-quinone oxidoreductase subunit N [Bacteroidales bacterium]
MLPNSEQFSALLSTLSADLVAFLPELILAGGITLLLFLRLFPQLCRVHSGFVAAGVVALALTTLLGNGHVTTNADWEPGAFTGLLRLDLFSQFLRGLLLLFTLLLLLLCDQTGIPDRDDSADFCVLLLGGTLGLMLMTSANHLLMVFIGLEMASLPSYALAGFLKGQRTGSEAALKYVVYGAASAGVTLYGISLLTAVFGTGNLVTVTQGLGHMIADSESVPLLPMAGLCFLFVGFGFKLAAVPFQFWLPDVFEGAAAEVSAFLSVASKAAAVGLTARVLLLLQEANPESVRLAETLGIALAVVATITATWGNLAALTQTNLKRMLGYSTIAHAGYMLMALSTLRKDGMAAVLVYLVMYLVMNLGAFAVVAVLRNRTGAETIAACRGLIARSPAVGVSLTIFLASLLGLPPLGGFVGKFLVFSAVYDAGQAYAVAGSPTLEWVYSLLLGVGIVNTVVSAGYYLAVLRSAGLDEAEATDASGHALPLGEPWGVAVYLVGLSIVLLILGLVWNPLITLATSAIR